MTYDSRTFGRRAKVNPPRDEAVWLRPFVEAQAT